MAVPADPNQTHNPAEEPFDPHGQIRMNDPLGKRIKTDADDTTTIPPADATGQRASRFQMTSITRSLLEPLEPPPPPTFPPTQLPIYRGDQQWPQRRRLAFAIIGAIVVGIILCLGIAIGVGLSDLRGNNGLAGNNTATIISATVSATLLLPTALPPLPTTAEPATPIPPTVPPPTQTLIPPTIVPPTQTLIPPTQTLIPPTTTLIPPTGNPTSTATAKQPTATAATTRRVFGASLGIKQPSEKSGNSGEFQSCIQGRVVDKSNRPISGAALGISNGALRYEKTTNTFGDYQFCGLGASNWQVTLFNIPPFKIAIAAQPKRTVYLNGANGQVAEVNFLEQ